MTRTRLLAVAALLAALAGDAGAARVRALTPGCAAAGAEITVETRALRRGAVTVGGIPATVTARDRKGLTFVMPGNLPPGPATVEITRKKKRATTQVVVQGDETCNGADDDCDGAVDDGLGQIDGPSGVQRCRNGQWELTGERVPTDPETPTGIDRCIPEEIVSCWDGTPETRNVGICSDGVRTCTNDGVFGPCEGQVLPQAEDPGNGVDENCDGRDGPGGGELCVPGDVRSCYDGPPSTRNVPPCTAGVRTCGETGLFGLCEGQVLPKTEIPGNGKDENCDGLDTIVAPVLQLAVTPPISPTFQTSQVIAGVVGTVRTEPPPPADPFTATIAPVEGRQGETLQVTFSTTGAALQAGVVQAAFGPGVTVQGLLVAGPSSAVATIAIALDATPGPRLVSIQNGDAEAVASNAFTVAPAAGTVSGRVTDADGNPVAGATVCLSGTTNCTTTDADGNWTLTGVPTTGTRVIIQAPGYAEVSIPIGSRSASNANAALGTFQFDRTQELPPPPPEPGAPILPQAVASVLARSRTTTPETFTPAEARKLVVDTILLVGGDELGVLDEGGTQLNPNVTGNGPASVDHAGVERLARTFVQGATTTLEELAFSLLLAGQWNATPPTIDQLIAAMQAQVDAAWADPDAETSWLSIVVFNPTPGFTKTAPQLSRQTRISQVHSFLFLTGLLIQSYEVQNPAPAPAPLVGPDGGRARGTRAAVNSYRQFTRALPQLQQIILGISQNIIGSLLFTMPVAAAFGGPPALVMLTTVVGAISDLFLFAVIGAQLQAQAAPLPPSIQAVEQIGNQVRVTIGRTSRDSPGFVAQAGPQLGTFYYTLYRGCRGQRSTVVRSNIRVPYDRDRPLGVFQVVDRTPEPGLNCYYADVLQMTGIDIPPELSFIAGTMAIPTHIGIPIGNIISLFFVSDLLSDFSVPSPFPAPNQPGAGGQPPASDAMLRRSSVIFTPAPITAQAIDAIRSASDGSYYVSDQVAREIRKTDKTGQTTRWVDPAFSGPAVGLAIDPQDALYAENGGTEAKFGGRCFRFSQPDGNRDFVGTVNKYSPLLDRGNTVAIAGMAVGPGIPGAVSAARGDLYVGEQFSRSIRRVPTSIIPPAGIGALPAPGGGIFGAAVASPVVGFPYVDLPGCDTAGIVDLDFDANQRLWVLTTSNLGIFPHDPQTGGTQPSIPVAGLQCSSTGAVSVDVQGPAFVVKNGRIRLEASGKPCDGLWDWLVEDSSVVALENQDDHVGGSSITVKGLKPGTSFVTAVYRTNGTQGAKSFQVKVLPGPWILVHGITDSANGWAPLKQHLIDTIGPDAFGGELCGPGTFAARQTRQVCETARPGGFYTVNFRDNQGNYRFQGTELADIIRQVREVNDADQVTLVAHSMGGLASRSYIQGIAGVPYAGDVERLITLDTPHKGSEGADLLQIPGFTELVTDLQAIIGLRPLPATLVGLTPFSNTLGAFLNGYLPVHEPFSAAVQQLRPRSGNLRMLNEQTTFPSDVALTAVVSTMPSDLAVNLCTAVGGLITDSTLFYDDVDGQPQSINLCDFFANGDIIVTRESQDPTDVVPHATKILRTDTHTMIPPFVTADFEIIDQLLGITP